MTVLNSTIKLGLVALGIFGLTANPVKADAPPVKKEWTILVYMNGNNSLDDFGAYDLNEMEKVGSTDQVNVVVEWASLSLNNVKRVYVTKDDDDQTVSSVAVEELGAVDMGAAQSLTDFIKWGAQKYPAKHYFVDVWDHGSGWHSKRLGSVRSGFNALDISWDDNTGNFITTEQLGKSLKEASKAIGQKIDLYGSDACLMQMAEVAGEMKGAVDVFLGSQELEPGPGWPYDTFLARLTAKPTADAREAATMLVEEYLVSYQQGSQGDEEVTLSALDMSTLDALAAAVKTLGDKLAALPAADKTKVVTAAGTSQKFYYSDYVDLGDFVKNVDKAGLANASVTSALTTVKGALATTMIANAVTNSYAAATGLSVWIPQSRSTYKKYADRYKGLDFAKTSNWGVTLNAILPAL